MNKQALICSEHHLSGFRLLLCTRSVVKAEQVAVENQQADNIRKTRSRERDENDCRARRKSGKIGRENSSRRRFIAGE